MVQPIFSKLDSLMVGMMRLGVCNYCLKEEGRYGVLKTSSLLRIVVCLRDRV